VIAAGSVALLGQIGSAAEPSAFELVKEGNRYIGEQAKDKVVQIRSEKSINSLTPNIWYVVYHDFTASLKAVEVKFAAGKMVDVKRPSRLLEPISGSHKPLDRDKLKTDSDRAIDIALKEPLLKNLTVKATRLKLERWSDEELPAWRVRLWVARIRKPNDMADIGEVIVSAADGKVLRADLKPNRAD
jgi:hypothetical protein